MIEIFIRVLPFFALIGLGYGAGRSGFFPEEATAWLTKFVFYFALSAMIFRFAAALPFEQVFNGRLIAGYLWGTAFVYGIATIVAFVRKLDVPTAAVEAQCAAIGNVGFLGLPMFAVLFSDAAIGIVMMVLATDLIVFSGLIVILINGGRGKAITPALLKTIALGLLRNPMIVSILLGLAVSASALTIPAPIDSFLVILGGAATPGALFAIGASLARKSGEKVQIALWLSFCKLALHPIFVAIGVLFVFPIDKFSATVVIAAAALPVAGNVFMLAQHYNLAAQRVSNAILFSTAASILSVPLIIALLSAP